MDKNTIISIAVATVFAIALISAQLQTGKDVDLVNGSNNSTIDSKLNNTVRQLDSAYLQWAEITSKSMKSYTVDITNAVSVANYSNLTIIGSSLKRDAGMSLNQSRYLEVSLGLKPSLEEIQKALEDYIIVGEYIETGGKNRDDEYLMNASNFARDASDHMTNASVDVQNYMRTLK